MKQKMERSGPNNPCPHCNRTKDSDCRWNKNVILCHSGSTLKPGEIITLDGRDWYLSRQNGGYDGSAAVFKPHKAKTNEPIIFRRQREAAQVIENLDSASTELDRFVALAIRALAIPPFEQMLDFEISAAQVICNEAFELGKQLITKLAKAKKHDPSMAVDLERVLETHRDLRYQLSDLNRYCANPGLYWEQMLINAPARVPTTAIEESKASTWAYWHNVDPSYKPKDKGVAELYDAYKQRRTKNDK